MTYFLKLTRNVVIQARHCESGSIVEVSKSDARQLVAAGRGKILQPSLEQARAALAKGVASLAAELQLTIEPADSISKLAANAILKP